MLIVGLIYYPFSSQYIYLTNWGSHLTIFSIFASWYLGREPPKTPVPIKELKGLAFAASAAYEAGLVM
jgi:hypothetical protein